MALDRNLDDFVTEDEVNINIQYWDAHCHLNINSSNIQDYLDCDGFRNLVRMGKSALPFIYKAIETGKFKGELGWNSFFGSLVREIAEDEFQIPKDMRGNVNEMKEYTTHWLKDYVSKLE